MPQPDRMVMREFAHRSATPLHMTAGQLGGASVSKKSRQISKRALRRCGG